MVKFDLAEARRVGCRRAVAHLRLDREHGLDAPRARERARDGEDEVCELDELDENLRQVIIERDELPLRQVPALHAQRAAAHEQDDGDVHDHIRQRVQQRRNAPDERLRAIQPLRVAGERGDLPVLLQKRAQHTHAREIFAHAVGHAVQPLLHAAVERDAGEHHAEHHGKQRRDRTHKNKRQPRVHRKRHDHRAEHHERRAQQQPQREVEPRLHLIHIARHAREQRRCAEGIEVCIAERADMRKQRAAQPRGKAAGGFCGKILRRDRRRQPQKPQQQEKPALAQNVARVAGADALVSDARHDERHDQLKARLQQLERRTEDALFFIFPQIRQQGLYRTAFFFSFHLHSLPAR